jgi:hypothetical protein
MILLSSSIAGDEVQQPIFFLVYKGKKKKRNVNA